MEKLKSDEIKNIIYTTIEPLVFRDYIKKWPLYNWNLGKWSEQLGERELSFRCAEKGVVSDEPTWERQCAVERLTFKNFLETAADSTKWKYCDYKRVKDFFNDDSDFAKAVDWSIFGFTDVEESTIWLGSDGAHTPAHQDTYGFNIVAQIYGTKRWLLFPPETNLRPTRVPYEESSIYSELNFYAPENLDRFRGISGCRSVELEAGDALVVPRGWWHYVQHVSPVAITVNTWLPHVNDGSARLSEALVRTLVAQLSKDMPQTLRHRILNPNEDDLPDTPLAVTFLQVESVLESNTQYHRQQSRAKRLKTSHPTRDDETRKSTDEVDITTLIKTNSKHLRVVPEMSNSALIEFLERNKKRYCSVTGTNNAEDECDSTEKDCLTKLLINSFCNKEVVDLIKEKILRSKLSHFSSMAGHD